MLNDLLAWRDVRLDRPEVLYWRTATGEEVGFVIEAGRTLLPIEVNASARTLVSRAETLAWDYGLRGYDAVQLAAALTWQESIGQDVFLGTFDSQLWEAAPEAGLHVWPERLVKQESRG